MILMFDWLKGLFKKKPKTRLGIDLGSSAIKLVEISSGKDKLKLETYGLAFPTIETEALSNKEISQIIKELLYQAQVKTNIAYLSLPVFATFSTVIDLPLMPEKEIAAAIPYEAKKYIPVPLEEVALDWSIIQESGVSPVLNTGQESGTIQVILVAILKEIIDKYTKIAQLAGLEIKILEAESFSLVRALTNLKKEPVALLDVGARFTNISLVETGFVKVIHNAKKVIEKSGSLNKESLAQETERVINLYQSKYNQQVKSIILTGGACCLPNLGLVDWLNQRLNLEVLIGNPFLNIDYPQILEPVLKEIGPSLAVAIGLAMRE